MFGNCLKSAIYCVSTVLYMHVAGFNGLVMCQYYIGYNVDYNPVK